MAEPSMKVNINSLPAQLQTASVRKFYDKDNSGFIETRNKDGINEYKLFEPHAKSLGVDLSNYNCTQERSGSFINGKGTQRIINRGPKGYSTQTWESPSLVRDTIFDKRNRPIEIGYTKFDKQTDIANEGDCQQFKYTELTKGKFNLTKTEHYVDCRSFSNSSNDLRAVSEDMKISMNKHYLCGQEKQPKKFTESYTLNGKPVQAKPVGKGRYEVTDEKGNVFYISHDGVNLKPEYVRNNP